MITDPQFVVIDIETTGLSAYYHKITEIAALKINNGKISDEFVTLVNPEVPIPRFITRLTGIDDDMVKDQPTINEVIPKFKSFLSDGVFVAHNSGFDYKFLSHASQVHSKISLTNASICTCKLARRLLPQLPRKNLSTLCDHFQVNNINAHRAKGDALATVIIFNNMLQMLKEKNIETLEDILAFQKSKIPK
jgi:DNA polymerase-3 subunit alpha (Gram-positive type)